VDRAQQGSPRPGRGGGSNERRRARVTFSCLAHLDSTTKPPPMQLRLKDYQRYWKLRRAFLLAQAASLGVGDGE